MRILLVCANHPISFSYSGGAMRTAMDVMSLAELGHEVHVVRFLDVRTRAALEGYETEFGDETARGRALAASWRDVEYDDRPARAGLLAIAREALRDPALFMHPQIAELADAVRESYARCEPDVVWSCGYPAGHAVARAEVRRPFIATLHDWRFELMRLRNRKRDPRTLLRLRLTSWASRRADVAFLSAARATSTGSTKQAGEMRAMGIADVSVMPPWYPDPLAHEPDASLAAPVPSITHLGSLETTSNRLGLTRYLQVAHPAVRARLAARGIDAPLLVIGEATSATPELRALLDQASARCTGPVHDLATVLRPFDVSIIPYEHATGVRSKVPLLFSLAQTVIATRASVAGMPEVVGGENCVLVERIEEFPAALETLIADADARARIALAGRRTFEERYTMRSQLEHYRSLLERALAPAGTRSA